MKSQPVKLTSHEYKVLAYLMHHRDAVVSRSDLIEHIYDQDFDRDSNTIEVFVGRLRRKLDPDSSYKPIETLRGRGYRMVLPRGVAPVDSRRLSPARGRRRSAYRTSCARTSLPPPQERNEP